MCSNEVLAREGIDTTDHWLLIDARADQGSNEVLAREGIDTVVTRYMKKMFAFYVAMRY